MDKPEAPLSMTPSLPTYTQARAFLNTIQGVNYNLYQSLSSNIWDQVGNPRENVDWTNPEEWIPLRLKGEEQTLALKIWRETKGVVNPRHMRGCWYLVTKHNLASRFSDDRMQITGDGFTFLDNPTCELVAKIDRREGLLNLLKTVSENSPGRRGDILPGYADFCNTFTNYHTDAVHKSSLYNRLVNLMDRAYVLRNGTLYEITIEGNAYLEKYSKLVIGATVTTRQTELYKLAQVIKKEARERLEKYLSSMDPYKFEHLIKLLLQEMGYDDVRVTAPAGDGGVDVVADIEMGISSVREVVQVKRHVRSIGRPVLDGLRGSLYRFKAQRGTIITTGKFAAGALSAALDPGVAPITLIDGDKLIDLLIQYGIGIATKTVEFYEFDDSKLTHPDEDASTPGEAEA